MKTSIQFLCALACSSSMAFSAQGFQDVESPPKLELEEVTLRRGGRAIEARVGKLTVPQFYDAPELGSLQLAVLVRPSTSKNPGPPIFYLNGIPAGASDMADQAFWAEYLELGDVVLFDQRGSGRSVPQLTWSRPPFRAERFLSNRADALTNMIATAQAIRSFTRTVGVDLAAFNTRESARDVNHLRRALGYQEIRLMGHSGGSHLAFEVLREFEDHIDSLVSLGTAGPNDIQSLPSQLDDFLRLISSMAAADERIGPQMPDLFERVQLALDKIGAQPLSFEVQHPETGAEVQLELGRFGLQFLLLLEFGDPQELALFPRLIHELEQGRTDVLSWFVEQRYDQLSEFPALVFINRAASGATAERWRQVRQEAEASPFDMARNLFSPELDDHFGIKDLGDGFRQPVASRVRTLFVSASLDGKTPPGRAEAVRAGFSDSAHIILENGGHNDLERCPAMHQRIVEFLAGDELEDEVLLLPPMRFALLEGEDPLVSHPALD